MNTNLKGVEKTFLNQKQHWKTFSRYDKMHDIIMFVVSSRSKWASQMLALPHVCQLLIRRGTQKPVAWQELACPLEALSKPN